MQQGDLEAAKAYVAQLIRNGNAEDTLAEALVGQLLTLQSRLLLHAMISFSFWGQSQVDDDRFTITVTRAFSNEGGWVFLKHYGDAPVSGDDELPSAMRTCILMSDSGFVVPLMRWQFSHDEDDDEWHLIELEDLYEAAMVAIDLCDGRLLPQGPALPPTEELPPHAVWREGLEPEPTNVHEWLEEPLTLLPYCEVRGCRTQVVGPGLAHCIQHLDEAVDDHEASAFSRATETLEDITRVLTEDDE